MLSDTPRRLYDYSIQNFLSVYYPLPTFSQHSLLLWLSVTSHYYVFSLFISFQLFCLIYDYIFLHPPSWLSFSGVSFDIYISIFCLSFAFNLRFSFSSDCCRPNQEKVSNRFWTWTFGQTSKSGFNRGCCNTPSETILLVFRKQKTKTKHYIFITILLTLSKWSTTLLGYSMLHISRYATKCSR